MCGGSEVKSWALWEKLIIVKSAFLKSIKNITALPNCEIPGATWCKEEQALCAAAYGLSTRQGPEPPGRHTSGHVCEGVSRLLTEAGRDTLKVGCAILWAAVQD